MQDLQDLTEEKLTQDAIEEIKHSTLMNDFYMSIFFKDNIKTTQFVLRIIMDKPDLIVKSVEVQHELDSSSENHGVKLDVYAVDTEGRQYDIEVQKKSSGAIPQRARFNSAVIDANTLKKNESYSVLKHRESVVIFITEHDVLKGKLPIYHINRVIKETGKDFNDGAFIVYVNTAHKDYSTALGKLIHDFRCRQPEKMYYDEIAEDAKLVYVNKEGKFVKTALDRLREYENAKGNTKGVIETSRNIAVNLIKLGQNALEDIAKVCGLTLKQVQELAAEVKND